MKAFTIKRIAWCTLSAVFTFGLVLPASAWADSMSHGQAVHHDTSPPLSEMLASATAPSPGPDRVIPIGIKPDLGRDPSDASPDGGLQAPQWFLGPTPAPTLSVSGLSEADNVAIVGVAIVPPDTNGDIGLDDAGNKIYIQYINLVWGVFDATTGALSAGRAIR